MNGSKYSNGSFNVIRKMNGTTNGDHYNGKTNGDHHNGKANGETYGKSNGYSNGSPNGEHNEQTNGLLNGDHHPKTNGELKGSIAKVCNGLANGESHEKLNGSTNGNGTHPGDLNGHECPTDDEEEEDNFTEEMLDALDEIGSEPASASGSASTGAKPKTATKQEDARQLFLTFLKNCKNKFEYLVIEIINLFMSLKIEIVSNTTMNTKESRFVHCTLKLKYFEKYGLFEQLTTRH